jgi:transcriptional regulator with XRE-family HTH domain
VQLGVPWQVRQGIPWDLIYTSSMTDHQELGMTIRRARLDKSMSLGQLASAVGRSSSSVRRWERGEVAPAASVLPKLAAVLEIDPELLDRISSPTPRDTTDETGGLAGDEDRVSTVEQPLAAVGTSGSSDAQVEPQQPSSSRDRDSDSRWSSLMHSDRGWMGWVRGVLTVSVLIVMLLVLIWAVGELFSALGAVLDSFNVGSDGG